MCQVPGGVFSSLKQLLWSSHSSCEESSDASSDSETGVGVVGQCQEGSSDDELNQGISELSVDGGDPGRSVGVCIDVRTTNESTADELVISEQQEYTFEDHQLVDLSHSSDFDSSGFFIAPSDSSHIPRETEPEEDDDVSPFVWLNSCIELHDVTVLQPVCTGFGGGLKWGG